MFKIYNSSCCYIKIIQDLVEGDDEKSIALVRCPQTLDILWMENEF